jgi:hypothetical protein
LLPFVIKLNYISTNEKVTAIADTLEMLGYGRIYHQREVIKNGHIDFWTDALNAHNVGDIKKLPTRADFDLILGNFQARATSRRNRCYSQTARAHAIDRRPCSSPSCWTRIPRHK